MITLFSKLLLRQLFTDYIIHDDPENAMWIHFTGTAAEKIVREFQLHRMGCMNNCNGYLLNILTLVKRRIDAARYFYSAVLNTRSPGKYIITGRQIPGFAAENEFEAVGAADSDFKLIV